MNIRPLADRHDGRPVFPEDSRPESKTAFLSGIDSRIAKAPFTAAPAKAAAKKVISETVVRRKIRDRIRTCNEHNSEFSAGSYVPKKSRCNSI
jgi:hypothetical protein